MTETYRSVVTAVGPMATEFAAEGILVFFSEAAPEELRDFAVIHTHPAPPSSPVEVGDIIAIGNEELPVTAVGAIANDNIAELGHFVLKLNGLTEAELPGDVCVAAAESPALVPGAELTVRRP